MDKFPNFSNGKAGSGSLAGYSIFQLVLASKKKKSFHILALIRGSGGHLFGKIQSIGLRPSAIGTVSPMENAVRSIGYWKDGDSAPIMKL